MRAIGDVGLSLADEFAVPMAETGKWRASQSAAVAAGIGGMAVILFLALSQGPQIPRVDSPLMRFSIDLGVSDSLGPTTAISPDGTRIAYRVNGPDGRFMLATRLLSETDETLLAGTEGAYNPTFSRNGDWIAFMAVNRLMKIPVRDGAPVALADAAIGRIGSWGNDGYIYAELNPFSGIFRIPENGGEPEQLTHPRQYRHAWPQALPDGRILYTAGLAGLLENGRIEVFDPTSNESTVVLEGGYMARYVATSDSGGYLLFLRGGVLNAVEFDLDSLVVSGDRAQLAVDVASSGSKLGNAFDVSTNGILVYSAGRTSQQWPIVWIDRNGEQQPLLSQRRAYYTPRVSRDGQRVAFAVEDERGQDIYVHDIERDITTRLTFDSAANLWPVWAPDGEHLSYTSLTEDHAAIWWTRADGTGSPRLLLERDNPVRQIMLSPDGATLGFTEQDPDTGSDLWIVPLDLTDPDAPVVDEPTPFAMTEYNEGVPSFSRDGNWIAYLSDELGGYEVWVQPFPGPGGRWQISSGDGGYPFWSATEDVLFYRGGDTIMSVSYAVEGDRFVPQTPRFWSRFATIAAPVGFETVDLAPDGRRFVVLPGPESSADEPGRATFLLNLFSDM